ncbi:discoidin domain-containing protein [Endozoicomonas atrinae]|uniref:discoidin domain-containing protein n=1 Tax=Endozoicomonas atrinae TaxID=1333660 RepID=UPI000B1D7F9F|nr:discoidin domain-containing protein [Endozoicomonas atrinae]
MKSYRRNLCLIICIMLSAFHSQVSIARVENNGKTLNQVTDFNKTTQIKGTWYGLKLHETPSGVFDKFTISTSTDNKTTWSTPTVVLSNEDLANKGADQHEDYTRSKLAAVKWLMCPTTGNLSIWAKRHGIDSNNKIIPRKELLRAAVLGNGKTPADRYTDSIIIDLPYGNVSGDLGEIVEDGKLYLASADTQLGVVHILELNDECSDIKPNGPLLSLQWFNDDNSIDHREAPAIFRENGYLFMMTSGKTGWRPNQHKYTYAPSVKGPWTDHLIPIGDSTAYHSQVFGVKRIHSSNGSGHSSLLFSGTRNAATWNGKDNRNIWMPLYFNTDTNIATNYYDRITLDEEKGTVTGYQLDHGTQLSIKNTVLQGFQDDVTALTDNDLSTFWYNNNHSDKKTLTFDLGEAQRIKAIKLKQFDQYNNKVDVSLCTPRLKVEVGNGQTFTPVFEDIVGSINWLQTINLPETHGQYLRLSLIENHKGNSSGTTNDFGFYEVEIWGNKYSPSPQLHAGFDTPETGALPQGWEVIRSSGTSASVIKANIGGALQLQDNNNNGRVVASHTLTPQKGARVEATLRFKYNTSGSGDYIRLMSGKKMLINIVNSVKHRKLAITDNRFNETAIASINNNTWYRLRLVMNTDANTYDIFLNDRLIWGGAHFAEAASFIDNIRIGTATKESGSVAVYDDITIHGPIQ